VLQQDGEAESEESYEKEIKVETGSQKHSGELS
jgi:hypothetical protein